MANPVEKFTIENKIDLDDAVLPTKQVKKVDEQLTIEFTDIKQEPRYDSENYQNLQEVKKRLSPNVFLVISILQILGIQMEWLQFMRHVFKSYAKDCI